MVKATDKAGNSAVVSKTVFTEGIQPEIAIASSTDWVNTDARLEVTITDKGLSSGIESVKAEYYDGADVTEAKKLSESEAAKNVTALTSAGGTIDVTREGVTTVVVTAQDAAGNVSEQSFTVRVDKTAPAFTGVADGQTYSGAVTMDNVKDALSGVAKADIVYTNGSNMTERSNVQDSYQFTDPGQYTVTLTDKAGNAQTVNFTISNNFKYVINVTEVDDMGRVKVEVLDGSMLTFYQMKDGDSNFTSTNVKHDSIWLEKTGVYYINARDAEGNASNTLYIIVAPSKDVTAKTLTAAPNRDVTLKVGEDENLTITKIKEIFTGDVNKVVFSGNGADKPDVELMEDGVYKIESK